MQVEDRDRADGEDCDDREDRQLHAGEPVQHYGFPPCWVAVPGGILNGSAACPERFAIAPVRKSGGLTTSARCFMFGSKPNDVVNIVSPSRRRVRSKTSQMLK